MKAMTQIALLAALIAPWAIHASQPVMDALETPVAAGPVADQPLTDGEVRRINKENRRLTIKHGEIANLDMPAMTMNFHVADAAMLELVQPGDRIRFAVEKIEGKYTVMRLEPVVQSNQ